MAGVDTIVVGGGIGASAPFTLNTIPYINQTDPASVSSTDFLTVVPSGATRGLIIGASDPDAAGVERLRVIDGIISDLTAFPGSTVLGKNHTVSGSYANGNLLVGRDLTLTSGGGSNVLESTLVGSDINITSVNNANGIVAIGYNITSNAPSSMNGHIWIGGAMTWSGSNAPDIAIGTSMTHAGGSANILMGRGTAISGTGSSNCVVIGSGANSAAANTVIIGANAAVSGSTSTSSMAFGVSALVSAASSILIGGGTVAHANCIVLAPSALSFAARQAIIGQPSPNELNMVLFGGVRDTTNAAGTDIQFRLRNCVTGSNLAGGNITWTTGLGTGTGAATSFTIQTSVAGGAATTPQTAANRFRIDDGAGAAGNTAMLLYDVDNGTMERVTVGAADSGGLGFKVLRIPN